MVTRINKPLLKALAVCTGFFSLASCREHSVSPSDLVPAVDGINTFAMNANDFSIKFYNRLSDSIVTSSFRLSNGSSTLPGIALGTYVDPFYGRTTASAYLQFAPYKAGFKFISGSIMDSAVLVLPYINGTYGNKSYGDTAKSLKLKVFRTTQNVEVSSTYYSSSALAHESTPIGTATIPFSRYNSSSKTVSVTGDTTTGQLRLKLDNSFAQDFRNADTLNFVNTSAFHDYFKGLYIVPDTVTGENLLSYFLLPAVSTGDPKNLGGARLEFYYHTADTTAMSSFPVKTDLCGYFSNFSRNYTTYPAAGFLNRNSDSVLIQSEPGFLTEITIDNLQQIPQAVINKAELVFTTVNLAGTDNGIFTPIDVLTPVLWENNQESPLYEILDNNGNTNTSGSLFVNPYAQKKTIAGIEYTQYRINIPRTLQHALNDGKTSITVRLRGSKNYPGMYRVLAPGLGTGAATDFQFNIIYTKKSS